MTEVSVWECQSCGDIVLKFFMPHNGTICNLNSCGGNRVQVGMQISNLGESFYDVAEYAYSQVDLENEDGDWADWALIELKCGRKVIEELKAIRSALAE